jgi:general nucleoside transport system ATP-binding protein
MDHGQAVIHHGHMSALRPIAEWTKEAVGLEMLGAANPQGAAHAV